MSSKDFTVTGGAGFIGTHLSQALLRAGHRVRVLDLRTPAQPISGVEYLQGDVRDRATLRRALTGAHTVFHLAAIASVPECQARVVESYETNLLSVSLLAEVLRESAPRSRVVFASSAANYGAKGRADTALAEADVALDALSHYAAQKRGAEQILRLEWESTRLPSVVFRFFNVFGPGQDPRSPYSGVISTFVDRALKGEILCLNDGGRQTRDFVSVHDIVRACLAASELPESECRAEPMNLGSGRRTQIRELAGVIRELARSSSQIEDAPAREGDVLHSLSDSAKAQAVLGWGAQVSLREGLEELMRGVSSNGS